MIKRLTEAGYFLQFTVAALRAAASRYLAPEFVAAWTLMVAIC